MFSLSISAIKKSLSEFYCDEEGASAIEYALIAAMVAVALVTFVTPIRTAITNIFTSIQTALTGAAPSGS
jgi:pilus assembly protein Flp/PilA